MNDLTQKTPYYGDGTAAGFKGKSREARQNSAAAAHEVTKSLPRRHRQMVEAWTAYGIAGAIPEEIAKDLGLPVYLVRPRAGELAKKGLLFEVGKRMGEFGCNVMAYSVERPKGGEA